MENNKKYAYGVVVIGPSGSGKTTFCYALSQFFTAIQRKHVIVNMDPANETMSYEVIYLYIYIIYYICLIDRN